MFHYGSFLQHFLDWTILCRVKDTYKSIKTNWLDRSLVEVGSINPEVHVKIYLLNTTGNFEKGQIYWESSFVDFLGGTVFLTSLSLSTRRCINLLGCRTMGIAVAKAQIVASPVRWRTFINGFMALTGVEEARLDFSEFQESQARKTQLCGHQTQ